MSGHLHCIAYREHYQLQYSLLHPAKVDELCFLEEIFRLLPIMEEDQLVELYISLYLWAVMLRVGRSIAVGHSSGCGCLGDHGSL